LVDALDCFNRSYISWIVPRGNDRRTTGKIPVVLTVHLKLVLRVWINNSKNKWKQIHSMGFLDAFCWLGLLPVPYGFFEFIDQIHCIHVTRELLEIAPIVIQLFTILPLPSLSFPMCHWDCWCLCFAVAGVVCWFACTQLLTMKTALRQQRCGRLDLTLTVDILYINFPLFFCCQISKQWTVRYGTWSKMHLIGFAFTCILYY